MANWKKNFDQATLDSAHESTVENFPELELDSEFNPQWHECCKNMVAFEKHEAERQAQLMQPNFHN